MRLACITCIALWASFCVLVEAQQVRQQVAPIKQARVTLISADISANTIKVKFPNGVVSTYKGLQRTGACKDGKPISLPDFLKYFKPGDTIGILYWASGPNAGTLEVVMDTACSAMVEEMMGKPLRGTLAKADFARKTVSVKLANAGVKSWRLAEPCLLARATKEARLPGDPAAAGPGANVFKLGEPVLVLLTKDRNRVRALIDEVSYKQMQSQMMGQPPPGPAKLRMMRPGGAGPQR
jgi:archaellum component FlaF (FlaF/FlaG flagellin family)